MEVILRKRESEKSCPCVISCRPHYAFPDGENLSQQWSDVVAVFGTHVRSASVQKNVRELAAMLKAIHAQEDRAAALEKTRLISAKLREMRLDKVAEFVEKSISETLSYMYFPPEHWERIMKEIRRRAQVVGNFPDDNSALMLVGSRLRHIASTKWGTRPYIKIEKKQWELHILT